MKTTLRFQTGGQVDGLYTEVVDLSSLGPLHVTRATDIRFDGTAQQWEVHDAATHRILFNNPSRGECLRWEHDNLQPSAQPSLS